MLEEAGIPERQHGFYAHWVRHFFNRNPGRSRRSLNARDVARFLRTLREDSAMEAWQVDLARVRCEARIAVPPRSRGSLPGGFVARP